ncbi:MAG TPA: sigma-70 region 4 domain-containing protein [Opitutaceae bacterium]
MPLRLMIVTTGSRKSALLLLDGRSYREIADTLGISESNVGVKLHRIKNELINKAKENESHET